MLMRWNNRQTIQDGSKKIIDNASIHEIQFDLDEIDLNWVDAYYGTETQ